MALQPNDFVIDDNTPSEVQTPGGMGRGLIPRDYTTHPVGFYAGAPPLEMPLIPRDEWVARIQEMDATKSRLSDIRRSAGPSGGHIPSLDQNGQGYCWAYSLAGCVMLIRALMHQPYVRLSGHMLACLIKNYRDEGGWCGLSLEQATKIGIASVEFWKEKSMSRSNDTPEMRANALKHIVTEQWADLQASVYDRNLTEDQAMTLLLTRCPIQGDFNHWSHSVCLMDPVLVTSSATALTTDFGSLDLTNDRDIAIYEAAFGKRGLNSWTDQYGDLGEFVLTGSKARLDGGVAALVTGASLV